MKFKLPLILLSLFCLTGCEYVSQIFSYINTPIEINVNATGVELDKHKITVSENNTVMLNASVKPTEATNKNVTWSSDNPSIATVDEKGNVLGLDEGKCHVTCTTVDGGFTDKCEVTVEYVKLTGIDLNKKELTLFPGSVATLDVLYKPSNASSRDIVWTSSDENVAKVEKGSVSVNKDAKKDDTCIITATSTENSYTSTCEIRIIEKPEGVDRTEMKVTYQDFGYNKLYKTSNAPTRGNSKFLVIPIWFNDSATITGINTEEKKDKVRSDIETAFFGTEEATGWNSVKSFYETESILDGESKVKISGDVAPWYEPNKNASEYYSEAATGNNNTNALVKAATEWYFANHSGVSKADYDSDKDGYLDAVICVYAAPDYMAEKNTEHDNMWAYCYWTQPAKSAGNTLLNAYLWASYDFMYGITNKVGKWHGGDNAHCKVDAHTYIHETGHLLGLMDYYDYSKQYKPAGGFSMQDCNVGSHDPYSIMAFGWAKPYIPTTSVEITIAPFQSSHDLILLTPNWNEYDSPYDEYLLLEYYTPTGLNQYDSTYTYGGSTKGVSTSGIRLWHVDSRVVTATGMDVDASGKLVFNADTLTTNIKQYTRGVELAFSNTYYSTTGSNNYISNIGRSYANYNILQLIRANTESTHLNNKYFAKEDLFVKGDSFSMEKYKNQFVNSVGESAKLNKGVSLGFSFTVTDMDSSGATIKIETV